MAADPTNSRVPPLESRQEQIRHVMRDCLTYWAQGQPFSEDALVKSYPALMPELKEELEKLRIATNRNPWLGESIQSTLLYESSCSTSLQLQSSHVDWPLRCPNCQNENDVELIAAALLSDFRCDACGHVVAADAVLSHENSAPPLDHMGHYDLLSCLGIGGFGAVYKAYDTQLDRIVALKIPRESDLSLQQKRLFLREAQVAAQLRHPNIVSIHEVGQDNDLLFIVSDYVPGVTLSTWLVENRPTFREAAQLCLDLARALEHAHERGVIHRDLKPDNIILDEGRKPHIVDFGLAKRMDTISTITTQGFPLGTLAYMSPEQAQGDAHAADGRSDIYSLGVILFELLTKELPFHGDVAAIIEQVMIAQPPKPRNVTQATERRSSYPIRPRGGLPQVSSKRPQTPLPNGRSFDRTT